MQQSGRPLARLAADHAEETDPSRWPPVGKFYSPGFLVKKAVGTLMANDQSMHWKQWKRAIMNTYPGDGAARIDAWERNTTGAMCQSASHCEDMCRGTCLMDRIKQHCARGSCASNCSVVPTSCDDHTRHCKFECTGGCLEGCIQKELVNFRRELQFCYPAMLAKCQGRCRARRKEGQGREFIRCANACIDKAQMTCIGAHTRPCEQQCGRHSCLEGRCACPAMLSGDDECTAKPAALWEDAPELSRHCFQSIFDPKFKGIDRETIKDTSFTSTSFRMAPETWGVYHWAAVSAGRQKTQTRPDLPYYADWTSCALVGSSGSLTGSGMGEVIDEAHTAWIRFNDAPTVGFERDVGSRTTLRIQNNVYCGFNEGKQEMCAPYTEFSTQHRCHPTEGRTCPLVALSDQVHAAVRKFMQPEFYNHSSVDVDGHHWNTSGHVDTSAGFFGTLLALHLCGEVSIYGFDQAATHYYHKKPSTTTKPFEQRHGWGAEHHCSAQYEQRYDAFRIVKGHELQKLKTALAARLGRDAPHPSGVEEEAADATPASDWSQPRAGAATDGGGASQG
eukprot:jgi/Tetstr1/438610/TSEL_027161.t1